MKIKKGTYKKPIILAVLLTVLVGGAVAYAAVNKLGPFHDSSKKTDINYDPPSKEQKKDQERTKQDSVNKDKQDQASQDSSPQSTSKTDSNAAAPQPSNTKRNVHVTISSVSGNTSSSDSLVRVRTVVNTIDNNGSCNITVSRTGSPTYNNSVDVQKLASFSSCKGFDIPKNKLGSGTWSLTIYYNSDNFKGSVSKTLAVQ